MTLKELRLANQLTMGEMGKIVGKSQASWSNYESGKTTVPDEVYEKLKEHFGAEQFEEKTTAPDGPISKCEMIAMQFLWSIPSATFKEVQAAYAENVAKQTVNTFLTKIGRAHV